MSELAALRAALEKVKAGLPLSLSPAIAPAEGEHWGTLAGLWYADDDHCADVEENPALGVGSQDMAEALALSVNLAPWLLAVAEAAAAWLDAPSLGRAEEPAALVHLAAAVKALRAAEAEEAARG